MKLGNIQKTTFTLNHRLEALFEKTPRSFKSISEPEARIGGYLGQTFDRNYQKTIYGISFQLIIKYNKISN